MNKHEGKSLNQYISEHYTETEVAEMEARAAILVEMVNARKAKKITQKDLEELSGIRQPVIARIETGQSVPQLDTLLKALTAMGKTLKVVDIQK